MSASSVLADAKASVLKCEATLNALETAFTQARRELEEVKSALDLSARSLDTNQVGSVASPRSPWQVAGCEVWEGPGSSGLSRSRSVSTGDIWSWGPDTMATFSSASTCSQCTTITTTNSTNITAATTNYMEEWEALWDAGQVPSLQESAGREVAEPQLSRGLDWSQSPLLSTPLTSAGSSEDSRAGGNFPFYPGLLGTEDLGLGSSLAFPREEETSSQSEAATASYAAMCSRTGGLTRGLCPQCRQPASQCREGKSLRKVDHEIIGKIIKTSGPSWPKYKLGRVALVVGAGRNGTNVLLKWRADCQVESFTLTSKNVPKFSLVCSGATQTMEEGFSFSESEGGMETASCVVRLPIRPFIPEVWPHQDLGEKHRIIISVDLDLCLAGIGLMVETAIPKIIFSICQQNDHFEEHNAIFSQNFSNVQRFPTASTVLKLMRKVPLKAGQPYMLVLNMFGGASRVGCGGEESLAFYLNGVRGEILVEDYKHRDNVGSKTTKVEKGIVEKFYIEK